ncbi:MAG: helix-turn-helix domain-containing protein [Acidobacteriia bacterium]|nr:helix-turn-helix domain-containing protein [Terriglobia bacterium]
MATANNTLETLLTEHDVAHITGLSVASIRRWRLLRQGPRFLKLGASVRYKPEDLNAWLASRPTGGSDNRPADSASADPVSSPAAATSRRGGKRNVQ